MSLLLEYGRMPSSSRSLGVKGEPAEPAELRLLVGRLRLLLELCLLDGLVGLPRELDRLDRRDGEPEIWLGAGGGVNEVCRDNL